MQEIIGDYNMTLPEYIESLNLSPEAIDEMLSERMRNILKIILAFVEEERNK